MKAQLILPAPLGVGTNYIHLFICVLIFISACSVFKEKSFYQADSLLKRKSSHEEKSESTANSMAVRIYTSYDSAEKQYYTEIFPKGHFNYSEAEGFSGQAERLLISGTTKGGKRVRDSSQLLQKSEVRSVGTKRERAFIETRLKEKESKAINPDYFYLAACGLIFGMIYLLRRFSIGKEERL